MTIQFPKYPTVLSNPQATNLDLAKECTTLLEQDANHPFGWISDEDRKALTSGKPLSRRNVLYKHYLFLLEEARLDALDTGFAEPGILPAATLEALSLLPLDRLTPNESRALRDAIGDVKRLDDDDTSSTPLNVRTSHGGRSQSKKDKATADRLLRTQMRGKQGQKPQNGRRAA